MGTAPGRGFRQSSSIEELRASGESGDAGKQFDAAVSPDGRFALNQVLPNARYARGMDESSIGQNRRSRRSPVLLTATIELGGAMHEVKLRNLSSDGALVQGADGLPEYANVTFCRKDLRVRARIAWVQGSHAGIAFETPLAPAEVLRHVPRR